MSDATPTSANKRAASPSSPEASHKRAREDEGVVDAKAEQEEDGSVENGNETESADVKEDDEDVKAKMDDTPMDG